jgi:TonB family protein
VVNDPNYQKDAAQSAVRKDVCPKCQTTLAAGNYVCFMCGTPRDEPGGGTQLSDHFPTFLSRPATTEPPRDNSTASPLPAPHAASVYEFPRPKPTTPEEEQPKANAGLRQYIALGLLLVVTVAGAVVVWNRRQEGGALFSVFKETLDGEITQLMYGRAEQHQNAPGPVAAPPSKSHPRSEPKAVIRVTEGPRTVTRALTVHVRPEDAMLPVAARVTEYPSSSNVSVAIADSRAAASGRTAPLRIQVSPRESLYLLLKQVFPVYPAAARAAGKQGAVVLKAEIGKDGQVKSLENVSGDPILVPAAIDAVKKWQYRPYYRDGDPQEVETLIVLEFSLAEARAANQMQ